MPGPQKENGYTPIANEIMDALCKYRIPGECRQVLDCVLRMTYGFSRKEVEISNNQISVFTGLKRQNVIRSIQWLESKLILSRIKVESNKTKILKFNKNYKEWIRLESELIPSKVESELIPKVESELIQNSNPTIIFKTNKTKGERKNKILNGSESVIYEFYLEKILPENRSGTRARLNIKSHLKNHSIEDLKQSVLNYSTKALKNDPKYRKDPANFFGKSEPYFKDFLPSLFKPSPKAEVIYNDPTADEERIYGRSESSTPKH